LDDGRFVVALLMQILGEEALMRDGRENIAQRRVVARRAAPKLPRVPRENRGTAELRDQPLELGS
jgi:hypothetical protein